MIKVLGSNERMAQFASLYKGAITEVIESNLATSAPKLDVMVKYAKGSSFHVGAFPLEQILCVSTESGIQVTAYSDVQIKFIPFGRKVAMPSSVVLSLELKAGESGMIGGYDVVGMLLVVRE